MYRVKYQELLLRAFARLQGCPKARLMILGEGPLRPMLEGLAAELGVSERVLMPGFVADPWPVLASADLFVLSSNYEGFPLVLAEAMHAGLKVVSTDCESGPAEMLENGRYGRLVPCGNVAALAEAMEKAFSETIEASDMRARSIAIAGPAMIARYSDLLTETR
jgi:glycosyltransferase involved in cell wall biosynthesis